MSTPNQPHATPTTSFTEGRPSVYDPDTEADASSHPTAALKGRRADGSLATCTETDTASRPDGQLHLLDLMSQETTRIEGTHVEGDSGTGGSGDGQLSRSAGWRGWLSGGFTTGGSGTH